jgi:hypothetical protein
MCIHAFTAGLFDVCVSFKAGGLPAESGIAAGCGGSFRACPSRACLASFRLTCRGVAPLHASSLATLQCRRPSDFSSFTHARSTRTCPNGSASTFAESSTTQSRVAPGPSQRTQTGEPWPLEAADARTRPELAATNARDWDFPTVKTFPQFGAEIRS